MISTTTPPYLYHGSRFKQPELMPGFLRSGKLVRWDNTESNKFLYATTEKVLAIELGFASSIEKQYRIDRFEVENGRIHVQTPDYLTITHLEKVPVFIYTIDYEREDGWKKNSNEHNGIDTEYKTEKTVHSIRECVQVDLKRFLRDYEIIIGRVVPEDISGQSKEVMESRPSWTMW